MVYIESLYGGIFASVAIFEVHIRTEQAIHIGAESLT